MYSDDLGRMKKNHKNRFCNSLTELRIRNVVNIVSFFAEV